MVLWLHTISMQEAVLNQSIEDRRSNVEVVEVPGHAVAGIHDVPVERPNRVEVVNVAVIELEQHSVGVPEIADSPFQYVDPIRSQDVSPGTPTTVQPGKVVSRPRTFRTALPDPQLSLHDAG